MLYFVYSLTNPSDAANTTRVLAATRCNRGASVMVEIQSSISLHEPCLLFPDRSSLVVSEISPQQQILPSRRVRDLSDMSFDLWRVVSFSHINKQGKAYWNCQCICGTYKPVLGSDLTSGKSESCGCIRRLYGGWDPNHPLEYHAFRSMWNRCTNPHHASYKNYGGRGIIICDRWRLFANFIADMGARPRPDYSLDRIDNDGPYCKENCRWTSRQVQSTNSRKTHFITFNNETYSIAEWARRMGMPTATLRKRFRAWSIEEALTLPPQTRYSRRKA